MTWEWLIAVPVYVQLACLGVVHFDSKTMQESGWETLLAGAFAGASERYADQWGPDDHPCPVELRPRSIEVWDPSMPGWSEPAYRKFPAARAGVIVQCAPYPSMALGNRVLLSVGTSWDRYGDGGGWALAHEFGHSAGMTHRAAGCSLMRYGTCSDCDPKPEGCTGSSRKLRAEQCAALVGLAEPWRPRAPTWR